jgi:hypothetical protein
VYLAESERSDLTLKCWGVLLVGIDRNELFTSCRRAVSMRIGTGMWCVGHMSFKCVFRVWQVYLAESERSDLTLKCWGVLVVGIDCNELFTSCRRAVSVRIGTVMWCRGRGRG